MWYYIVAAVVLILIYVFLLVFGIYKLYESKQTKPTKLIKKGALNITEKNNDSNITMRDLDDAFNAQEAARLEDSAKGRSMMQGVAILTAIYTVISTVIWGMFFYRGGPVGMSITGYIIDALVIGFAIYANTDGYKDRAMQVVFGTMLLCFFVFLTKNFILYPAIVNLLGMD